MSVIYIYKVLKRSSGGPNPWCWEEKWIIAKNRKEADREAEESHCKAGEDKVPVFIKRKKFIKKKHGARLPRHWVNAPCGYFANRVCHECGNFWGAGGCRSKFGDKTSDDKFCHYKKNIFWRPK